MNAREAAVSVVRQLRYQLVPDPTLDTTAVQSATIHRDHADY